jgi:hypothetical protein
MTMRKTGRKFLRGAAVLTVALLAACAAPATHSAAAAAPTPCGDSSYVRLRQQHPDSLSERSWQRLQTLDRECVAAHTRAPRASQGTMGPRHGGGHMMGMGIVATVMMVAMMVSMW